MSSKTLRAYSFCLAGLLVVITSTGAKASSLRLLPPSTASAVVVAATSKGSIIVLPTMTGPAVKMGGPGTVAVNTRGNIVYAAPEWGRRTGQLLTLSLTGRRLKELSSVRLGGTGAVSIAVAPDAKSLVVANYSTSSVSVVRLDARGIPMEVVTIATPTVPSAPHAVAFFGENVVLTDLRNDRLELLSIVGKPRWLGSIAMRSGDGPRSIAVLNDRQLVVSNELANSVSCFVSDKGSLIERGRVELGGGAGAQAPKPADIVATSETSGAVVVRGPDELIRFSVRADCQLEVTKREFDVVDSPRPLVRRGPEIWMGISTAVMVSAVGDNWGAISTQDPVYAMVVVR